MANSPYGLSALMEAVNHLDAQEKQNDLIANYAAGTMESVSYIDAVEAGLVDEGVPMGPEDENVDENDPKINALIDSLDDDATDVEDIAEESLVMLDEVLESYVAENYYRI